MQRRHATATPSVRHTHTVRKKPHGTERAGRDFGLSPRSSAWCDLSCWPPDQPTRSNRKRPDLSQYLPTAAGVAPWPKQDPNLLVMPPTSAADGLVLYETPSLCSVVQRTTWRQRLYLIKRTPQPQVQLNNPLKHLTCCRRPGDFCAHFSPRQINFEINHVQLKYNCHCSTLHHQQQQ